MLSTATREAGLPRLSRLEVSFTFPALLSLILGTHPLIRLEVDHPLPVGLELVGVELPQASVDGL